MTIDPEMLADQIDGFPCPEKNLPLTRGERNLIVAALRSYSPDCDALVKALRSADCPAGGWTGQPTEIVQATVADCLGAGVCGCSLGDAVRKAEPSG